MPRGIRLRYHGTMSPVESALRKILEESGVEFEIIACDPDLADTAVFCRRYGYAMERSANTIVVKTRTGERKFAACLVLAHTRLDVNKTVRKRLGARKVSFASADESVALTGMPPGGITPLGLPETLPLWVDRRVMDCEKVILGGGNRSSKIIVKPEIFTLTPATTIIEGLALAPPADE